MMKYKMKFLLIVIVIVLIIIIYIINLDTNTIDNSDCEDFDPNIFRFNLYSDNPNILSKNKFNQKFNSHVPELNVFMAAVGIDMNSEPNVYVHVDYPTDSNYISIIVNYWKKYIHNSLNKDKYYFILCYADGYIYNINDTDVKFGKGKKFITNQPIEYPIKNVLAFSKRYNDIDTICIPDPYYCGLEQHKKAIMEVKNNYMQWDSKIKKCIWRGNIKNNYNINFFDETNKMELTPREYFVKLYYDNKINNFNYSDSFTSISEQIKYRYILDIDGYSNTWDATVWKLFSGSILLKVKSTWKQWYYDELIEWEHYIPISNDFSDLNEKIEWCINNDDKCKIISENANNFVLSKLNLEYVNKKTIENILKIL